MTSALIEFKNKNILIGFLNIVVTVLTLPINFLNYQDYRFLFVPLIICVISLVFLRRNPDDDRLNVTCIISIVICTVIEIFCISIPILYGNYSINNLEKSLQQIKQLDSYTGQKGTNLDGYNIIINGKKVRLEHKKLVMKQFFLI